MKCLFGYMVVRESLVKAVCPLSELKCCVESSIVPFIAAGKSATVELINTSIPRCSVLARWGFIYKSLMGCCLFSEMPGPARRESSHSLPAEALLSCCGLRPAAV